MRSDKKAVIRRVRALYLVFVLLFGVCAYRIYSIQHSGISTVADMQFSRKYKLAESRGYIYDINMKPLVNSSINEKYIVLNSGDDITQGGIRIKDGLYICDSTDVFDINENSILNFAEIERYSGSQMCSHIIGYTDSSGKGVSGIEKAFNSLLSQASGEIYLNFSADAGGKLLYGDGISLEESNYISAAGIVLTIDSDIQRIAELALEQSEISTGAVVILDAASARISAVASKPCYDVNNLASSLNNNELPFLNRALEAYPVGSVFKPFVLAAALENDYQVSDEYNCTGDIIVNGNTFSCYNFTSHGAVDANKAIEKSCNTFFINMGLEAGAENIISTARLFGFSKDISLCSTLISDGGNVPEAKSLVSQADLANLCFGQGTLLATPLQIAAAYNTLANGGIYIEPTLLSALVDENLNAYAYYKPEDSHFAVSKRSCELICAYLYNNMLNGTGVNGAPENVSSAGKTATAQTGRFDENGKEILCTWFAGFFPYENPQYTVVIFNENGSSAAADCAPVFKECAEKIYELKIR